MGSSWRDDQVYVPAPKLRKNQIKDKFRLEERQYTNEGETTLAIGSGWATGEGEESQQNEIHLPGLWTERMGEAGRAFRLLRLL
jgi:hypothetical protein